MNQETGVVKDHRVAAVVVTRDRPGLLKEMLQALKTQTVKLAVIVVVDNASGPETVGLLEKERDLHVLRMDCNTGGSGGFAKGVAEALTKGPDWVWLLDDDVIVREDSLEGLLFSLEAADQDLQNLGVLCPAVEEHGQLAGNHRRYFDPLTLRERAVPERSYRSALVEVDTASFVGFLVRSEAIRRVGLPDARYFLFYDDTDYSLRLKQAGYRLFLVPGSRVDHRRPANRRLRAGPYGLRHYYYTRNRIIVYRKYGQAPAWRWLWPLAQGVALLLVAGRLRTLAVRWWYKALRDGLAAEPHVLRRVPHAGPEDRHYLYRDDER